MLTKNTEYFKVVTTSDIGLFDDTKNQYTVHSVGHVKLYQHVLNQNLIAFLLASVDD